MAYLLKEKQMVGGELKLAGEDVTDTSSAELAALLAHDKVEFVPDEEDAKESTPPLKKKQNEKEE